VSRFRFIQTEQASSFLALPCRSLGVSRAGSCAWARRGLSTRAQENRTLTEHIRAIHARSRGTYGAPRVHAELRASEKRVSRKRVARLMHAAELRGGSCGRQRVRTTVVDPAARAAPNLVGRGKAAPGLNRLWLGDITYLPTAEGWLYLAVLLDAYSRRVVGWAMADHLRTELAVAALARALQQRQPLRGEFAQHTDRGCQYTARAYQAQLVAQGIACSMSQADACYDNALAESFFGTLKAELVAGEVWPTRRAARLAVFEWIEGFYNRQRRHFALSYLSPVVFEAVQRAALGA
jgi:putative transposase